VVPDESVEVDGAKAAAVREKMQELLTSDDSEAVDYLETEKDALHYLLGREQFGPFDHAVKQYNFAQALDLLKQSAKS
jgi:hypothetical protein